MAFSTTNNRDRELPTEIFPRLNVGATPQNEQIYISWPVTWSLNRTYTFTSPRMFDGPYLDQIRPWIKEEDSFQFDLIRSVLKSAILQESMVRRLDGGMVHFGVPPCYRDEAWISTFLTVLQKLYTSQAQVRLIGSGDIAQMHLVGGDQINGDGAAAETSSQFNSSTPATTSRPQTSSTNSSVFRKTLSLAPPLTSQSLGIKQEETQEPSIDHSSTTNTKIDKSANRNTRKAEVTFPSQEKPNVKTPVELSAANSNKQKREVPHYHRPDLSPTPVPHTNHGATSRKLPETASKPFYINSKKQKLTHEEIIRKAAQSVRQLGDRSSDNEGLTTPPKSSGINAEKGTLSREEIIRKAAESVRQLGDLNSDDEMMSG